MRANQAVGGVVRTSDTRVTITLDAQAAYDITAAEVISVTVPAAALVASNAAVVAAPVLVVTVANGSASVYRLLNVIRRSTGLQHRYRPAAKVLRTRSPLRRRLKWLSTAMNPVQAMRTSQP